MQSLGWEHYEVHEPEPHILLFKYVAIAIPSGVRSSEASVIADMNFRRPLNFQPPQ
jgi:hypothetical protein